jgi:hypothetical protein
LRGGAQALIRRVTLCFSATQTSLLRAAVKRQRALGVRRKASAALRPFMARPQDFVVGNAHVKNLDFQMLDALEIEAQPTLSVMIICYKTIWS